MNVDIYRESTGVKAFLSASIATAFICGSMTVWAYLGMRAHQPQAHPADGRITAMPPEFAILGGIFMIPIVFVVTLAIGGCAFGIFDFLQRKKRRDAAQKA